MKQYVATAAGLSYTRVIPVMFLLISESMCTQNFSRLRMLIEVGEQNKNPKLWWNLTSKNRQSSWCRRKKTVQSDKTKTWKCLKRRSFRLSSATKMQICIPSAKQSPLHFLYKFEMVGSLTASCFKVKPCYVFILSQTMIFFPTLTKCLKLTDHFTTGWYKTHFWNIFLVQKCQDSIYLWFAETYNANILFWQLGWFIITYLS